MSWSTRGRARRAGRDRSVIDGELVALAPGPLGEAGQDFDRLWRTVFGRGDDQLCLVVFDAPQLAGELLSGRPWHERRSALQAALPGGLMVGVIDVFDSRSGRSRTAVGAGL